MRRLLAAATRGPEDQRTHLCGAVWVCTGGGGLLHANEKVALNNVRVARNSVFLFYSTAPRAVAAERGPYVVVEGTPNVSAN